MNVMVISEDFRKDQYILKPIISILIFAIVLTLPSLLITEAATINLGYDETEPVNYAKLQTPQSSNAWRTYINANNVSNLAVEGDYVWATTSGTGVVRWHPVDSTYVRYTTNDGLVSNVVSTVAIDGMEHKWFGTNGGVNEFDDTHWITYTVGNSGLVSNLVSAIAIDSEGNKWFGTAGGVSKLDNANSWTTYTISNSGLVNNFVFAIAIDNGGNKWFGTAGGVSKLDNTNNWTTYTTGSSGLVSNDVHAIAIDCVGNKWFGTTDGISKFDGISWTTYTTANSYLVKYDVSTIAVDDVCNVWIGTSRDGVSKFDGSNWTFYTEIDGLASNYVRAIAHDESGSVWFGSAGSFWRTVCQYSPTWQCRVDWVNGGMSKFDGSRWTTYTMGPAANGVFAATIDTARHQWFGTEGGISHFDGTDWTIYNTINSGLVDDNVQAIAIDGAGEIWIGSVQHMNPCDTRSYIGGGISRFDGNDWATYATNLSVYAIAIDDADNKWFGTAGGVRKFNGNNWTAYTATNSGLVSNYVFAIAIDNTGNKWFGTYAGVSKFDGTNWTAYTTGNSGLVSNSVRAITIDDAGNKWFGTDAGVSKFDGTNWSTYTTGNSGLVNNYVRAIAIDPAGSIWFGSGQWLGGHSSALIVYYRSYSGFLIKEVCTLFTDNGVKGGVSQFDGSTWITYTTANSGLANNYVPAIAIDGVDKWFGTWGGGVSILRTSEPLGNRSYLPIIAK